jgi:hypothetical protein
MTNKTEEFSSTAAEACHLASSADISGLSEY